MHPLIQCTFNHLEIPVLVLNLPSQQISEELPSLKYWHGEFMMTEFVRRWTHHKAMVTRLSHFFYYLECYGKELQSMIDVGLSFFQDQVTKEVWSRAKDHVIALIDVEREGGKIDRALLKNFFEIFTEIGMKKHECYEQDFEQHVLIRSTEYYREKASRWIMAYSCPEYMLKAEDCLQKEKDIVPYYLHSTSEQKLLQRVGTELLVTYETQLLENENSGLRILLKEDKVMDLSRMYRLYQNVPKVLEHIGAIFKEHIINEGTTLIQQAEDHASIKVQISGSQEQVFIQKVIEMQEKFTSHVNKCFMNHNIICKAVKEAFEVFLNKGVLGNSIAKIVASFCDNIVRMGATEKLSDEAIEGTLEKVVELLAYVTEKDLFAQLHRKNLLRRLLFDKISNYNVEISIITKLRKKFRGQFTSKMEGMVRDFTLQRENQIHFEEYLINTPRKKPEVELSVTVLTTAFWPRYKYSNLKLPYELAKCVDVFQGFYATQSKHKKLTWVYSLGCCNVTGMFDNGSIDLIVDTYQAATLVLFNTSERLTYSEISAQLNLDDVDMFRILHSLSCSKYNILIKEPRTKAISQNDIFTFNAKFTDKMRRIRVPLPPVDENKNVAKDVQNDRICSIDALIVRILKGQKVMGYQHLLTECGQKLSHMFKPDFKTIKQRIEHLITKDYMERDKENPNIIRYLA